MIAQSGDRAGTPSLLLPIGFGSSSGCEAGTLSLCCCLTVMSTSRRLAHPPWGIVGSIAFPCRCLTLLQLGPMLRSALFKLACLSNLKPHSDSRNGGSDGHDDDDDDDEEEEEEEEDEEDKEEDEDEDEDEEDKEEDKEEDEDEDEDDDDDDDDGSWSMPKHPLAHEESLSLPMCARASDVGLSKLGTSTWQVAIVNTALPFVDHASIDGPTRPPSGPPLAEQQHRTHTHTKTV
eukprot:6042912-Amphidinium_carterae.1